MKITKLGHCCMVIEEQDLKIVTDPGLFTIEQQSQLTGIDVLLITHEHADHLHAESVQELVKNNPDIIVITNAGVGKILTGLGIEYKTVEHGQSVTVHDVVIEAYGNDHHVIYEDYGLVQNTGYFIANTLWYPGDAFTNPGKPVKILALPVSGPWVLMKEALDYAKVIHPTVAFPVHDGFFSYPGPFHGLPQLFLPHAGIQFLVPEPGVPFSPLL